MNAIRRTAEQLSLDGGRTPIDPRAKALVAQAYSDNRIVPCYCRNCARDGREFVRMQSEPGVVDWIIRLALGACALLFVATCYIAATGNGIDWMVNL